MDKRRTIVTTLTVVTLLILGEQLYQLVHHDISRAAESQRPPIVRVAPKSSAAPATAVNTPTFQTQLPAHVAANQQQLITHQQQYIALVNQYELAKMQRQLLEEEVAIATARQRIAELNQKTQQLTGRPPAVDEAVANTENVEALDNHPKNLSQYQLVYLDRQGDNYTATLVNNGHYQEVATGIQLADGEQIKQIDTRGVLLQTADNKAFRLTFNGLVPVEEIAAPPSPPKIAIAAKKPPLTNKPPTLVKIPTLTKKLSTSKKIPKKVATAQLPTKFKLALTSQPKSTDFNNISRIQTNLFNGAHALKISPLMSISAKKNNQPAYTLDEILLLELPPTSYTIKLKGAYNKHELISFAQQNALGENAIYYTTSRHHKSWHVLLYSYFNTKAEAQAALMKLPTVMLQTHPQIQSIGSVQQCINAEKS